MPRGRPLGRGQTAIKVYGPYGAKKGRGGKVGGHMYSIVIPGRPKPYIKNSVQEVLKFLEAVL